MKDIKWFASSLTVWAIIACQYISIYALTLVYTLIYTVKQILENVTHSKTKLHVTEINL